jgi:ribosome biogenesis GTPase / thiamine phosphate phosphatase
MAQGEDRESKTEHGLVVAVAHDFFEVVSAERTSLCTLRGRLRKSHLRPAPSGQSVSPARLRRPPHQGYSASVDSKGAPALTPTTATSPLRVAPGDHVRFTPLDSRHGIIEEVLPRRTFLSRARSQSGTEQVMLANLDQAVLVFAVREPEPHFGMLDRYLALCEHAGIEVTICLNKVDLGIPPEIRREAGLYLELGYSTLYTSAETLEGIGTLCAQLKGRTSLLTGPSGVGKSSLINVLVPAANQRTGEVSDSTGKGRHTTTGVRLLPLEGGGWLGDSAGIRELALWNVPSDELARTFVELRPSAGACLFENCDHSEGEGGCALREVLASGLITPGRFASFERLLAEAREAESLKLPAGRRS